MPTLKNTLGNVIIAMLLVCIAYKLVDLVRRFVFRENYYANSVNIPYEIDLNRRADRAELKAYRDDKQSLDVSQINMSKMSQSYPNIDVDKINTV